MSSKQRRRFGVEKKAQIVRRHLAGKVAVSDLADEYGVQPSQIHSWVKQVLDQAEKAFERSSGPRQKEAVKDAKIARLEEKLTTKNEVISELMEENVKAKKANGDLYKEQRAGMSYCPSCLCPPLPLAAIRPSQSGRSERAWKDGLERCVSFLSCKNQDDNYSKNSANTAHETRYVTTVPFVAGLSGGCAAG